MLVAVTLSVPIPLLSGTLFTSEMTGSAGEIKETHELFARENPQVATKARTEMINEKAPGKCSFCHSLAM